MFLLNDLKSPEKDILDIKFEEKRLIGGVLYCCKKSCLWDPTNRSKLLCVPPDLSHQETLLSDNF